MNKIENQPIYAVKNALRMSRAAPKLYVALEVGLPAIRQHYEYLRTVAMVTEDENAVREADLWLTIVLLDEAAVEAARPVEEIQKPPMGVYEQVLSDEPGSMLQMPRRIQ